MSANSNLPTAVLIDGENISADTFQHLQAHLKAIPGICIIRVFGDFSNGAHTKWLEVCRSHGLEPVLHCSPVTGKNGADILMTIAAMDILATAKFRRIVLVSSDSDFLPLARRLRAGGIEVIGIGLNPATAAHLASYSKWLELAGLPVALAAGPKPQPRSAPSAQAPADFRNAVRQILGNNAMSLADIGKILRQSAPDLVGATGKGKLKKRIQGDCVFQLDNDMVSLRIA